MIGDLCKMRIYNQSGSAYVDVSIDGPGNKGPETVHFYERVVHMIVAGAKQRRMTIVAEEGEPRRRVGQEEGQE